MIRAEVVWDPPSLDGFEWGWAEVFVSRPHEPSASFEWTRALWRNHVRRGDRLALVILRDGRNVVGSVLLVVERAALLGVPLVTVRPLSERYNTHSDLLLSSTGGDVVGAFLDALFDLEVRWDVFRMGRLLEGSALVESLEEELSHRRVSFRSRVAPPSFVLPLPASFDAYLAARSAKFRSHLRRVERQMSALGEVRFLRAGSDLDVHAAFAALLDIDRRSWKHAHGTAISAVAHQRAFYEEICLSMSLKGQLHLSLLAVDGQFVAYNLGLGQAGVYYYLKASYDAAFRQQGPSAVARARLIASLISDSMSTLDFHGEPYEWEAQWASEVNWHRSLVVFNRSLRGRAWSVVHRLREAWRDRPPEGTIEYVDPKSLKGPDSP